MQWKTIKSGLGNTVFGLCNNGRKLLTLAYQTHSDRVYIESEDGEKRYFKCSKTGFLKNKVVLENEYGTRLGKLKKENGHAFIVIDEKKYALNFPDSKNVEIIAEDTQQPLTVCSLDLDNPAPRDKDSLIMVMCYYLLGHPQKMEEPRMAS
ncbi:hypothetical protein ABDK00_003170 [Niabella insulamsoli]|uniref:hypothetical protein n=1 Tax=Niabella insulamsoli TaxID=3144874 RepID=UPI0031FC07B9